MNTPNFRQALWQACSRPMAAAALVVCALGTGTSIHAEPIRMQGLFKQLKEDLPLPKGVERIANVPYGTHPLQRMDVYLPTLTQRSDLRSARAPVIFMVHGGGWRRGDKALANTVQEKVARWVPMGIVLISINYRLLPEAPVDQQLQDVVSALTLAQRRAGEWNADPNRFILMGHSAGGHLVALTNAKAASIQAGGTWPWLGTVALDSGVLNVPAYMQQPHVPLYDDAFGSDPRYWVAVSPYHQWRLGAPPMQMVCSLERQDNPCLQADNLSQRVAQTSGRSEVLRLNLGHGEINGELGLPGPYTDAVETFLASLDPIVASFLGKP